MYELTPKLMQCAIITVRLHSTQRISLSSFYFAPRHFYAPYIADGKMQTFHVTFRYIWNDSDVSVAVIV